ncbi:histidinol dehydrogenase [Clostridium sp. AF22-10]|uniref:histidinol dehydrogenase n=1 Tax=unclassified Clostridium TaxID=2614128 RepID=UPI00399C7A63
MIKIIKEAQVRSEEDNRNLRETVAGIIGEVRGRGDAALREYNEKFDGCTVNRCGSAGRRLMRLIRSWASRSWRI